MGESVTDQQFDEMVAALDPSVLIVTTRSASDEMAGCLVGFSTQCSITPRRYLVCLSKANHTFEVASGADYLVVHAIERSAVELAHLFAEQTGDQIDKFDRCEWAEGPHGLPILEQCRTWFVGRIVDRGDLGDHVGHVLAIEAAGAGAAPADLLRYHDVADFEPGHNA